MIRRLLLIALCVLAALLSASVHRPHARPERPLAVMSLVMQREAEGRLLAGDVDGAINYFEAALVADARNADAHVGLARTARAQNLPGKAIAHYRSALALRPNDAALLADQGAALIARGAAQRAQENLALLNRLCADGDCSHRDRLAAMLGAPRQRTALTPSDILPRPVVEPAAPQRQ